MVLFGTRTDQQAMLSIYLRGHVMRSSIGGFSPWFEKSGLIEDVSLNNETGIMLAPRHPALTLIHEVLQALSGAPAGSSALSPDPKKAYAIDPIRPLGHKSEVFFRSLVHVVRSGAEISVERLCRILRDVPSQTTERALSMMHADGIIDRYGEFVRLTEQLPKPYVDLVLRLASILEPRDTRLGGGQILVPARPGAFRRASDGAPRLFGSDVRLRNMMGLAVHGPMYMSELRGLAGLHKLLLESSEYAPFGRGGIVRTWQTERGPAAYLDPAHPLHMPIRRLLLKLEERYPVRLSVLDSAAPIPPAAEKWDGDKLALFGTPVPTNILLSIGCLGWTYEALCVKVSTGYAREVVKKALQTLHDEGIVESDRDRRPGFDIRVVRIASDFTARNELLNVLQAAVDLWPEFLQKVRTQLGNVTPKTRSHLKSRGLWPEMSNGEKGFPCESTLEHDRRECLRRYYVLAIAEMRPLSQGTVMHLDSNLARAIRKAWPTFADFAIEAGIPTFSPRNTSRTNDYGRRECIREYEELAKNLGQVPNTSDLNRLNVGLCNRILKYWGSFPKFCQELHIEPARRHRSTEMADSTRREECIEEYRALAARLGYAPSSWELRKHTAGLYKRIKALWCGFKPFQKELGVRGERRYFESLEERQCYSVAEYRRLTALLGHAPSSQELFEVMPSLMRHIKVGWGGFGKFSAATGLRTARKTG